MAAETILKEHGLRLTDSRKEILKVFLERKYALSHAFLEAQLQSSLDRVTIYRTLYAFEEKGIIHKVPDEGGSAKYALCNHQCATHHHLDNHVHFKCENCGETKCIDDASIPKLLLPEGFKTKEIAIIVTGTCNTCNNVV